MTPSLLRFQYAKRLIIPALTVMHHFECVALEHFELILLLLQFVRQLSILVCHGVKAVLQAFHHLVMLLLILLDVGLNDILGWLTHLMFGRLTMLWHTTNHYSIASSVLFVVHDVISFNFECWSCGICHFYILVLHGFQM